METSTFRTRTLENGTVVPEKVWIMFFQNSTGWLPLQDWDGNQLFWRLDENGKTDSLIKKIAHEKFSDSSWGLAPCSQKDMDHSIIDNL